VADFPAPAEGIVLTHFLVSGDVGRSRAFYTEVLGGEADIAAVYADWSAKGAQFLTEPIDRGPEIRCYLRDPDGHLIEVGQSRR